MDMKGFSSSLEWRSQIPEILYPGRPEFVALYQRAWELAHDHIMDVPGMPQTPYMDEGFCNTFLWIWDTCFMSLFCKYAQSRFPGVESFKNFYAPIHDAKKLPTIIAHKPPSWTGAQDGKPFDMKICILDNPPLFAWAEYQNALFSADDEHIRDLLLNTRYLQKHFQLLERMTKSQEHPGVAVPNYWRKHANGYFWEGGASGMDNTPRGRTHAPSLQERPNNPDMLWLDAIAQQGASAYYIAKLAELINEKELAQDWATIYQNIRNKVNSFYWNEVDGCYYDISAATASQFAVQTPATFWPLLSCMSTQEQAQRLFSLLEDPAKFGGQIPLPTLSRDDVDFMPNGAYWRGCVWIPTAYMVIKGVENYGNYELCRRLSVSLLTHMAKTYFEYSPHTIWECYHPSRPEPGRYPDDQKIVRPDFCGWSALAPISLLIENVIGIHSVNAFTNTVEWFRNTEETIGIKNLRFGNTVTDLISSQQTVTVTANQSYTLKVDGVTYPVSPGTQILSIAPK